MTDNDQAELRAAAELIVKWADPANHRPGAAGLPAEPIRETRSAMKLVGESTLAEHPADEQFPLTWEWIRTAKGPKMAFDPTITGTNHLGARYGISVSQLRFGPNTGRWEVTFLGFPFRLIDTRGELVRLCRALGVQLNEGNQS